MKSTGRTETGLRSQNEDRFMILNTDAMHAFAVSDGMGGHRAGETASKTAVETLSEALLACRNDDWESTLYQAFLQANHAVHSLAQSDDAMYGMGCTLVAALCSERAFIAANVGDSRLYYFDGADLKQITHDHSFVAELVRRGIITRAEAKTHPRRNLITRAIGTEETVSVDVFDCAWQPGDMLLLCSDGLCGVMDDAEMAAYLRNSTDLDATCASLISRALQLGSRDNITVVIVKNDGGLA